MNGRFKEDFFELSSACMKIRKLMQRGRFDGGTENLSVVRNELEVLYRHLRAIAVATLFSKRSEYFDFESTTPEEIEDRAHEIVVETFFRRTGNNRSLAILDVISNLFQHNPEANDEDIFRFLRKTVHTGICNFSRKELGERNPLFLSIAKKLDYYIKNSERYTKIKGVVFDSFFKEETHGSLPTADNLLHISSSMPLPTNVAKATDCFFDSLLDMPLFRSAVELPELRKAVYRALEHRLIDGEFSSLRTGSITPKDSFILELMHSARIETLLDIKNSYDTIEGYSAEELTAFLDAGNDYLYDYISKAELEPISRYLAMHLDGCKREVYEKRYKGRFQHFIKKLKDSWQKKLHANPLVSLHI